MSTQVQHPRCPYCHEPVKPREPKTACVGCMSWHHLDCWDEHERGCAACGRHARFGLRDARAAAGATRRCPRCLQALEDGVYGELEARFCLSCWGSWLPVESLGPLLLALPPTDGALEETEPLRRETLVRCFTCLIPMAKWLWRGVALDCCPGHGLWLDSGELPILRSLAQDHPHELYALLSDLGAGD